MPTPLTYTSYQAAVVVQIPTLTSDPNFATMLPLAISYAEDRISRELDLQAMHGAIALGPTVAGTALITVPASVMVLEGLYYGTNAIPVVPTTQDFIRLVYAGAVNGAPAYFARLGAAAGSDWTPGTQLLLGPTPDAAYTLSGYGTQRETTLSATYPQTFISTWLPELFFAGSMVWWAGYMKNYGSAADDPQQPGSWENVYKTLLTGAGIEEARKQFRSQAWTAQQPAPIATPPRK